MLYESEALGRQLGQWTKKTTTRRNTSDWEWRRF